MSVKKLAVKDADGANTLVLHSSQMGCCDGDYEVCKYCVTEGIESVVSITIKEDGENKLFPFETPGTALSTEKDVRVSISKALKAAGYDPYYDDIYKGVQVNGDEICIIGEAELVSINIDGTEFNLSKYCTSSKVCKQKGVFEYDTDPGFIGGTQIYNNIGFPAGDANVVKAALILALDAESVDYTKVEVTEDVENSYYVYTIHVVGATQLTIDDALLIPCGCYPDFVA